MILQIDRVTDRNAVASLFQLKRALGDDRAVIPGVAGNFSPVLIMEQIDFPGFVALRRINLGHNAARRQLDAFDGIRHQILSDGVKFVHLPVSADQHLLQGLGDLHSTGKFILDAFTVGICV